MAFIVPDEGLIGVLQQLQAGIGVQLQLRLDTVATAPANSDTFAGIVEPTYGGYAPIPFTMAIFGLPGGGSEDGIITPVSFGPSPPGATDVVQCWCITATGWAGANPALLFRKTLTTPWDTSIPGFSLTITPKITTATS